MIGLNGHINKILNSPKENKATKQQALFRQQQQLIKQEEIFTKKSNGQHISQS